jgi:hypothetical protein
VSYGLPQAVIDPEGACPARTTTYEISPIETGWLSRPHDFEWIGLWRYLRCFYCGGRHPETPKTNANTKGEQCPTTD